MRIPAVASEGTTRIHTEHDNTVSSPLQVNKQAKRPPCHRSIGCFFSRYIVRSFSASFQAVKQRTPSNSACTHLTSQSQSHLATCHESRALLGRCAPARSSLGKQAASDVPPYRRNPTSLGKNNNFEQPVMMTLVDVLSQWPEGARKLTRIKPQRRKQKRHLSETPTRPRLSSKWWSRGRGF